MSRWTNALLLIAALGVALLAAEGVARFLFPHWAPRTGRITSFWRYDSVLGWVHKPGAEGRFRSFGFDAHVRINTSGFRGSEIGPPSPERKRALLFGDSYVWGFGVDQDEVVSARLAALCPGLDVINLAVSGYSTDQELLLLRRQAPRLEPDVVVLVVAANDFESNLRPREYVYYYKPVFELRDGQLELTNQPVPRSSGFLRLAAGLAQRSYVVTQANRVAEGLLRSLGTALGDRKPGAGAPRGSAEDHSRLFPRNPAERLTATLVDVFLSEVRELGAEPILVFTDGQGQRARDLVAWLDRPGLGVVYLEDYMPAERDDALHLPGDFHWSPEGHSLAARVLAATLSRKSMSGGSCAGPPG